jgi:hypothetical protein
MGRARDRKGGASFGGLSVIPPYGDGGGGDDHLRDGAPVSLSGATLTTSNNVTWTLGNLSGLTDPAGTYVLTLTAAGSGAFDVLAALAPPTDSRPTPAGEGIDSPQSRTSWYTEFDKRKMSALIQSRI